MTTGATRRICIGGANFTSRGRTMPYIESRARQCSSNDNGRNQSRAYAESQCEVLPIRRGCGGIHRQSDVITESCLQPLDSASLIAASRAAANADGTNHLAINHDRNAARICEEVEESDLSRSAIRIVLELHRPDGSRLARLERRLRLQQRRANVIKNLPVH